MEVCIMFMIGAPGNLDVIQVCENENDVTEDAIHQPLECLGCILQTKGQAEAPP